MIYFVPLHRFLTINSKTMIKQKLTITYLLIAVCLTAMAQDDVNLKFGKPTKAEMEMTTYAPDSAAEAVVLCRLTNVEYTVQASGYLVDYHEKFRIKVLKPEGARYAMVTIPYTKLAEGKSSISASRVSLKSKAIEMGTNGFKTDSNTGDYFDGASGSLTDNFVDVYTDESVEDLKATAFNLVNGKTVKTKLNSSDVKKEKIDDERWQVEFTVPNVKEGTVIEYEYTIHSQLFYLLHDWFAQGEIPVAYACLDMDIPNYLIFNIEEHGIQRLVCKCVNGVLRYKLESDPLAAPVTVNTNHYTCVGRNLKALHKDAYVWNLNDYCAGITAELKSLSLPGMMRMDYVRTWDQIDRMLLDDNDLGKQLNSHSPLRNELEAAKVSDIANERERMAAVCKLVLDKVKWDGTYRLWTSDSSGATLKRGTGSNADVNMLLIQSLRDAGLQAYPVVLRTRDEGLLPHNFPSLSKLNSYVVGVQFHNGSTAFVDASSENGLVDAIPPQLQVERARLVIPGKKSQWVNLQKVSRIKVTTVIEATLTAQGLLQGRQTTLRSGFGQEAKEEKEISLQGTVDANGISFSPYSLLPIKANPFTDEQRLLPVEFPSVESEQVIVNVTLPEGYAVENVPEPIIVATPDKGLNGRLATYVGEGKIETHYQFNINKVTQPDTNYAAIRDMFALFSSHSEDVLVAKRK